MKLTSQKKIHGKQRKPFLVLPIIQNEKTSEDSFIMPVKNPGLNLFIKTWPPKRKGKNKTDDDENNRPLTATLDKPTILDIRLIGRIDMSKIRKEFLNISNICKMPLILKTNKTSKYHRPLSLPPPEKSKFKIKKKVSDSTDSGWEDEESSSVRSARSKTSQKVYVPAVINPKKAVNVKSFDANNNNTTKNSRLARKGAFAAVPPVTAVAVKTESNKSTKLAMMPEPCQTCGRRDQPERFHSHPHTPNTRTPMEGSPKIPVKSSVQKPVAIKYKSKLTERRPPPSQKIPIPTRKVTRSPQPISEPNTNNNVSSNNSRKGSGKRTLTCYLCGREFGSASLHLHEPRCLEKWERENAKLPLHLQRKPPPKPDASVNKEEWDRLAWEASQASLVPCQNCGRTFYPDRLLVHQRSCKASQQNTKTAVSSTSSNPSLSSQNSSSLSITNNNMNASNVSISPTSPGNRPPTQECYICGKLFGSKSIKIHEKQCLKKWNLENESLPLDMRSPPPTRKEKSLEIQQQSNTEVTKEKMERPPSGKKPPLFPCYICGRQFSVNSIYIHEPQCLKMWKIENDKLPPNKRRPQPLKPDIKFTQEGKVDYAATTEAIWQTHLSQLVACKNCSRTFNPDRVEVHERSCKGV